MMGIKSTRKWLLEDRYNHGLGGPPNMHQMSNRISGTDRGMETGVEYHVVAFQNDASEIWICEKFVNGKERWRYSCSASTFRKMAFWYLWRWIWGEWFGLRRKLFYWFLRRDMQVVRERLNDQRDK
jgi:hypothetical protein